MRRDLPFPDVSDPPFLPPSMTREEYREYMARGQKQRKHKYGVGQPAERTVDGILFASKAEARRYGELKLLQELGYIRRLKLQPVYPIEISGKYICKVILDFRYWEGCEIVVEDVKGFDTQLSKLKRKLVEAQYPEIKVKVVK